MESRQKRSVPFDGLHWIVEDITWAGEYKLKLWFRDGSVKIADLHNTIFEKPNNTVFEPLKDISFFSTVYLGEGDTATWDGEIDFAPEFLYEIGVDVVERTGTD